MELNSIALTFVPSNDHDLHGHPENPNRFNYFERLHSLPIAEHFIVIPPQPADEELILRVHPQKYLEALKQAVEQGPGYLDYGDTYITPASYEAARMAAGGVLQVLEAIIEKRAKRGFAMIRPPGHHATQTRAMGFCILNNIAIAARHAQTMGMSKILIVDFDVHHGNGTQQIFEADPTVSYFSTHQSGIFPGTGYLHEKGIGDGEGTVVNIPLPGRTGDQGLISIFERILLPISRRFAPDMIMVSAGFDGHWRDPLANLILTRDGYYHLSKILLSMADSLCQGRLLFVLEGGYDPKTLQESIAEILSAIAGSPSPFKEKDKAPYEEISIEDIIERAISIHGLKNDVQ